LARAGGPETEVLLCGRLRLVLLAPCSLILLLKSIDAASGINELLAAGKERVAGGADFHADIALMRGARFKRISAGPDNIRLVLGGVNSGFHGNEKDSFRDSQYSKNRNPVDPETHGVQVA